jgi:hypothetical protein
MPQMLKKSLKAMIEKCLAGDSRLTVSTIFEWNIQRK